MYTLLRMVGVPLKVSTLPSVLIGLIYLAYQYIHVYHGAGSATFNSLVENNQYSSRRRLKFLKDLSNGIVVSPKVAKRFFQPLTKEMRNLWVEMKQNRVP